MKERQKAEVSILLTDPSGLCVRGEAGVAGTGEEALTSVLQHVVCRPELYILWEGDWQNIYSTKHTRFRSVRGSIVYNSELLETTFTFNNEAVVKKYGFFSNGILCRHNTM